jgi:hypothetical protein
LKFVAESSAMGNCLDFLKRRNSTDPRRPVSLYTSGNYQSVLFATAVVLIEVEKGVYAPCRAVLDSGAQCSCISQNFVDMIGIRTREVDVNLEGANQVHISRIRGAADVKIMSKNGDFGVYMTCMVLPQATKNIPAQTLDVSSVMIPQDLELADPEFYISRPVDLLIGGELFWEVLGNRRFKVFPCHPILQETKFGWVVVGNANFPTLE